MLIITYCDFSKKQVEIRLEENFMSLSSGSDFCEMPINLIINIL